MTATERLHAALAEEGFPEGPDAVRAVVAAMHEREVSLYRGKKGWKVVERDSPFHPDRHSEFVTGQRELWNLDGPEEWELPLALSVADWRAHNRLCVVENWRHYARWVRQTDERQRRDVEASARLYGELHAGQGRVTITMPERAPKVQQDEIQTFSTEMML